jgi:hypothetical protein
LFVEHGFRNGMRRLVEPSFGFRYGTAERPAQFGEIVADLDAIDADGNDRARAHIGATPSPAAAQEFAAEFEVSGFLSLAFVSETRRRFIDHGCGSRSLRAGLRA